MRVKHCQKTKTKKFKNRKLSSELRWKTVKVHCDQRLGQNFPGVLHMFDIFHILRARNMINNKRYVQKVQNLIEWNQDNTYRNELMYFGQSRAKSTRESVFEHYF